LNPGRPALALGLLLALAAPVWADGDVAQSWVQRWLERPTLTGNWGGLRDRLETWGITPSVTYSADLQASVLGGRRRGQAYASDFNVTLDVDLEKVAGLPGLSGQVSGDWAAGSNLSNDIGNFFQVAQYWEGNKLRLYTLFLSQTLFEERLDLKVGRFATGDDFLTSPVSASLVNEALNPILFAVQANVPGVTAYPNATWGGRVIARPAEALALKAGAFYSDPFLNPLDANGTEFAINPEAGYFVIGEAVLHTHGAAGVTALPGRYRLGGYYDSNLYAWLADPSREQRGNYGFFLVGDQMVYRPGAPGSDVGLTVFGAFIYAPLQRINTLPYFASVGVTYRGLLPGRTRDTAAFAAYYGGFSRDLPGQTYELVLEWTYAIALAPWLTVQPDVQYVINPDGRSRTGNALVVGVQIAVQF
jgi:porin